jgi:hypothetical protein
MIPGPDEDKLRFIIHPRGRGVFIIRFFVEACGILQIHIRIALLQITDKALEPGLVIASILYCLLTPKSKKTDLV